RSAARRGECRHVMLSQRWIGWDGSYSVQCAPSWGNLSIGAGLPRRAGPGRTKTAGAPACVIDPGSSRLPPGLTSSSHEAFTPVESRCTCCGARVKTTAAQSIPTRHPRRRRRANALPTPPPTHRLQAEPWACRRLSTADLQQGCTGDRLVLLQALEEPPNTRMRMPNEVFKGVVPPLAGIVGAVLPLQRCIHDVPELRRKLGASAAHGGCQSSICSRS
ncbi:hypothetical protein HPB47_024361, partial [Ixodes persulcatus]